MPIVTIRQPGRTVTDPSHYYQARVSDNWLRRHDNGALVSCGLTVGETLTERDLQVLVNLGTVNEITQDEWNHSGCQSSCIRRGGKECRW